MHLGDCSVKYHNEKEQYKMFIFSLTILTDYGFQKAKLQQYQILIECITLPNKHSLPLCVCEAYSIVHYTLVYFSCQHMSIT